MLNFVFKTLGGLTRDLVEAADSTYETAKEVVVESAQEVASIPDMLAKGYSEGIISNGDNPPDKPVDKPVDKPAAKAPEPKATFPPAA